MKTEKETLIKIISLLEEGDNNTLCLNNNSLTSTLNIEKLFLQFSYGEIITRFSRKEKKEFDLTMALFVLLGFLALSSVALGGKSS